MRIRWMGDLRPFYAPDDPVAPQGGVVKPSEVLSQYSGDALRMAERLAEFQTDNFTLREKNRVLRQERDAARGTQPADGSRVLSAEEATTYDAYLALGKLADIQTALATGKAGQERLATLERDALLRAAAEAHGYQVAALAKLPSLVGKTMTLETAPQDGKPVTRALVQTDSGTVPLPDYIATHDPELLPALALTPPAAPGTAFVPQTGRGATPAPDPVQAHVQSRYVIPKKPA